MKGVNLFMKVVYLKAHVRKCAKNYLSIFLFDLDTQNDRGNNLHHSRDVVNT